MKQPIPSAFHHLKNLACGIQRIGGRALLVRSNGICASLAQSAESFVDEIVLAGPEQNRDPENPMMREIDNGLFRQQLCLAINRYRTNRIGLDSRSVGGAVKDSVSGNVRHGK